MHRRAVIRGLALGALLAPHAARTQQSEKVYRLGFLSVSSPPAPADLVSPNLFPLALRDLGYLEGQSLVVEWRFAEGKSDRLPGLARDLVHLGVDAIVAVSPAAVQAAKRATSAIPIVMFSAGDPVAQGWVASLARPGGNITGVVIGPETQLADKRLELIKEAVPRATRIGVLATSEPHVGDQVQDTQRAASSLGVTLVIVEIRDGDYERAFAKIIADRARALVVPVSAILNRDRKRIIELAAKHRLPAIYQWREHAEEGGLMAYGSSISALYRRAAACVDRIFRGASPAELPVEQPTTYELTINLRTARTLGLTFPPSIRVRAEHVIE